VPTREEGAAIFKHILQPATDRDSAILLSAQIHNEVASMILERLALLPHPPQPWGGEWGRDAAMLMFDRDGPLHGMSSTLTLAFAMRLIDGRFFENANTIRRIRNVFAHAMVPLSFDTPEVAAQCAMLTVSDVPHGRNKERFSLACVDILLFCHEAQVANLKRRVRRVRSGTDKDLVEFVRAEGKRTGVKPEVISDTLQSLRQKPAARRPRPPRSRKSKS
jgi:hypothetical protein